MADKNQTSNVIAELQGLLDQLAIVSDFDLLALAKKIAALVGDGLSEPQVKSLMERVPATVKGAKRTTVRNAMLAGTKFAQAADLAVEAIKTRKESVDGRVTTTAVGLANRAAVALIKSPAMKPADAVAGAAITARGSAQLAQSAMAQIAKLIEQWRDEVPYVSESEQAQMRKHAIFYADLGTRKALPEAKRRGRGDETVSKAA